MVNHDNACVANESSFINKLDISIGGVLVEFDSLADVAFLEKVTSIVNSLLGLQLLDLPHNSSKVIPNSLISNKARVVEELNYLSYALI